MRIASISHLTRESKGLFSRFFHPVFPLEACSTPSKPVLFFQTKEVSYRAREYHGSGGVVVLVVVVGLGVDVVRPLYLLDDF